MHAVRYFHEKHKEELFYEKISSYREYDSKNLFVCDQFHLGFLKGLKSRLG